MCVNVCLIKKGLKESKGKEREKKTERSLISKKKSVKA